MNSHETLTPPERAAKETTAHPEGFWRYAPPFTIDVTCAHMQSIRAARQIESTALIKPARRQVRPRGHRSRF